MSKTVDPNANNIPTFVQISGGRTSGMMGMMLKTNPNTHWLFQNTGREMPQTYDFLRDLQEKGGLPIVWLEYYCPDPRKKATFKIVNYDTANRDGLPFSQLMDKRKYVPNLGKRFCTTELKVMTARRYIRSLGIKKWYSAIGFRADEDRTPTDDIKMQTSVTPLKYMGVTKKDVMNFWKMQDFDLDLPYMPDGRTFGGNCMGCFFHSEYQHAALYVSNPKEYQWLIDQEEARGHTFNRDYSFKELAEYVDKHGFEHLAKTEMLCTSSSGSCGR